MEISPTVLRGELAKSLREINKQIEAVESVAASMSSASVHTEPTRIRDSSGNFMLAPLLVAKVECLYALTLLQTKGK